MKGQVSLVVLVPWEIMKGFSLCDRTQFLVGLETTRVTEAAFTLLRSCLTFHTFSVAKAGSTVEISLYNYTIVHFRNLKHEECFFFITLYLQYQWHSSRK